MRAAKDRIPRNPRAAQMILLAGAAVHFMLCIPLFGRRGYPEVDPVWLAMTWLWVPAIPLSAMHDRWSRKRARDLLLYALIVGFTVSWSTVMAVPSNKTPSRALVEMTLFGPVMIVGVACVEAVSRGLLNLIRTFIARPFCEQCEYNLHGLRDPRCPECGTPFPAMMLDSALIPTPTPISRRWTTWVTMLAFLACSVFPVAYRTHMFRSYAESGERTAEEDWADGKAKWFVRRDEEAAMTPRQTDRFEAIRFHLDPVSKLDIELMKPGWQHLIWESAYRKTIERKLQESGKKPPSFD